MKNKIKFEFIDISNEISVYNTLLEWTNLVNNTHSTDPVWSIIPALPGKSFLNLKLINSEINILENDNNLSFSYTYEKIKLDENK